jgi:hypothetical protein
MIHGLDAFSLEHNHGLDSFGLYFHFKIADKYVGIVRKPFSMTTGSDGNELTVFGDGTLRIR